MALSELHSPFSIIRYPLDKKYIVEYLGKKKIFKQINALYTLLHLSKR